MQEKNEFKGALSLLASAGIYAFFNVMIRELSKMYGDQAQVAARFSATLVLLLLIHLARKRLPRVPKEKMPDIIKLGLTMAGLVTLITVSVNSTKIANTVFLIYAGSISGAFFLGTFILKEAVTRQKIIAISLALIGLSFFLAEARAFELGLVTGFLAGLLDSVANTFRKRLKGVNRNSLLVYQYSIMVLGTIFLTLVFSGDIIRTVTISGIAVTIFYAVLLVTLGNLLLYGFQHFDVNVGTVILASELFFALILGVLLYDEIPTLLELTGGLIIFTATTITVFGISKNIKANNSSKQTAD